MMWFEQNTSKVPALLNEDFDGSITGSKLAAGTLTGGEFVDEFLNGSNVSSNSLTEGKFVDLSLRLSRD